MSYVRSLLWPFGYWSETTDARVPAPPGWPASVDDAVARTGYRACTPTTLFDAMAFYWRIRAGTMQLVADFGGGDVLTEDIPMVYNRPLDVGGLVTDELHLVPPFAHNFVPFWTGVLNADPLGPFPLDQINVVMFTEFLWFNAKTGVAIFNLTCTMDFGWHVNGNSYGGNATTDFPPFAGNFLGTVTPYGGATLTMGGNATTAVTGFTLGPLVPTTRFVFAKADSSEPQWNAFTGARLIIPARGP